MKYLMFVCADPDHSDADAAAAPDVEEWFRHVTERDVWVAGDRLRPVSDATTVRVRSGELLITDGPFTESREWIAGYDVLDCEDLDEGIEIAARHPMAHCGRIELRPIHSMGGPED
jgi:hypothetical protein